MTIERRRRMIRFPHCFRDILGSNLNLDITVNFSWFSTVPPVDAGVVRAVSPGPHYITSFPVHQSVRCRPSHSAYVKNGWSSTLHSQYSFMAFKGRTLTFNI